MFLNVPNLNCFENFKRQQLTMYYFKNLMYPTNLVDRDERNEVNAIWRFYQALNNNDFQIIIGEFAGF